mgnify:CR=1 FL=1
MQHWRTSAKTGEGVDELFNRLAADMASQPEAETLGRVCIVSPSPQYVNSSFFPCLFVSFILSWVALNLCGLACSDKVSCCCSIMAPPPPNVVARLFASLTDQCVAPLFPSPAALLRVRGTDGH